MPRWPPAQVCNRTNGSGCPQCIERKVCKHNSLARKHPSVAAQWDYAANVGTPDSVVAHSSQHAAWHCDACVCRWHAQVSAHVSKAKVGCPKCAQNAKSNKRIKQPTIPEDPFMLAQWGHCCNAALAPYPDKIRLKSNKQIFWLCSKCLVGQLVCCVCKQDWSPWGRLCMLYWEGCL